MESRKFLQMLETTCVIKCNYYNTRDTVIPYIHYIMPTI